jgi:hypothetical protein
VQEFLGERTAALTSLDCAFQAGLSADYVLRYPGFDRLQAAPEFADLVAAQGFTSP